MTAATPPAGSATRPPRPRAMVVAMGFMLVLAGPAAAQFEPPLESASRLRISGAVVSGTDAPTPEPGDEIGALFEDIVVGRFVFTSGADDPDEFSILIFGDDPSTGEVEGPTFGDPIEFEFFDSSTNMFLEMTPLNDQGESVTVLYEGDVVPTIPGLPLDLTPTRGFDLRIGGPAGDADDDDGDGGGDDDGDTGVDGDVNADGRADKKDAALVVQVIIGGARTLSPDAIRRADVNGDGSINTADVAAILRKRPGGVRTPGDRGSARGGGSSSDDAGADDPS